MSFTCPFCESVIADDGKTVEKEGAALAASKAELAAYRAELPKLEKKIARLEARKEKKPDGKKRDAGKPERPDKPPAGLSPFQLRKWRDEHGG